MLKHLFRARPSEHVGDPLYAHAVRQARDERFYTTLGVADRIDARFELYTLHVLLLILRLRDEAEPGSEEGAEAAQSLFDVYVSALDNTLRELGVGDISMARKMRKLGESLYGRMTAYEGPIRADDSVALSGPLARNVHETDDAARGQVLAGYALEARRRLAGQAMANVIRKPSWPEIAA